MTLSCQVLGRPGRDNALFLTIDTGRHVERLLFDCGDGCASELSVGTIQSIDHLFFSHFHMDHVAGFDQFFRCTYGRTTQPNRIWGPSGSAGILQHRFRGYLWNLHDGMSAAWRVSEIDGSDIRTTRFELREAFEIAHDEGAVPHDGVIHETPDYAVEAIPMDHKTVTLAYVVREKPRWNIDPARLAAIGLKPGPWLRHLKSPAADSPPVVIDDRTFTTEALRREIMTETPGESAAYLTDFLLDEAAIDRLAARLAGVGTLVCEGQYRHADLPLARKHFHMTTALTATLARRAGAGELILFHLSERYDLPGWIEMLDEARAIFPNTNYPAGWKLGGGRPSEDCA